MYAQHYSIIAGYCARIYDRPDFRGESHEIEATIIYNFPSNWNDRARSVKVTKGCKLKLFNHRSPQARK